MTDITDALQNRIPPGESLIKTLDLEGVADKRVAELKTLNRMMNATFYSVPQDLMPFVHQPTHCALDDLYLNTTIPADVFLLPENFFQLRKSGEKGFIKRLQEQLDLLKITPEPKQMKAESLSDPRLGTTIVRRKKDKAEIWRLIIAQEKRFKARQNCGYDA